MAKVKQNISSIVLAKRVPKTLLRIKMVLFLHQKLKQWQKNQF